MNDIISLLSILFIVGVGYSVIWGFGLLSRKEKFLAFGCSYGLGIGIITMQMYVFARLSIPWNKIVLLVPWLILALVLGIKNRKELGFRLPRKVKFDIVSIFLLAGILLSCAYSIFEALIRPVSSWDAWVTWLLKSKAFFIEGKITPELINYLRVNYPLVINLLGTFIYILIGRVDDTAVLLTSSAFYVFTAILLFAVVKKKYGSRYALLFTFLLVTTQNFVRHGGRFEAGIADLPIGYFTFCSVVLLLEYLEKSSTKVFLILNIFLGLTGLIKFEGIPIGIVIGLCALYHLYRQKLYKQLPFLIFWIIPIVDWDLYQRIYHLRDPYFNAHPIEVSLSKTIHALWGTFKELINIKSWNMLWIIYFYVLIIFGKKTNKELVVLNLIILSQLGLYIFLYIFTAANNPESSIERLLMHIAPLVFYYIAIVIAEVFPSFKQILNKFSVKTFIRKHNFSPLS